MTRRGALLLTLAVLTVAGCGTHRDAPHPGPPPGWPQKLTEFTMVWSAEPGIELATGPAVAVRAYTESFRLATLMSDTAYAYPGFGDAVGHADGLWPAPNKPHRKRWVGSERDHILSITRTGDQVTAVVCTYLYGSATATDGGGEYEANSAVGESHGGIYPEQITMTAPSGDRPPLPPQRGPARAPQRDVFGGWRITDHRGGFLLTTGTAGADDMNRCVAREPDPDPRRAFLVGDGGVRYHPRGDFPTLPAYPGWPIIDNR